MTKEPVIAVMIIVWIIQRLLEVTNLAAPGGNLPLDPEVVQATAEFILFVGAALIARAKVFSRSTLQNAGLNPAEVEQWAADPTIPPNEGGPSVVKPVPAGPAPL